MSREKGSGMTAAEFGQELLLHNEENDEVHILNPSAKLLLSLYKEGKTIEEMEKALRTEFSIREEEPLTVHIRAFLQEIEKKRIS
jgi:hypothetical protein